jgi:hypothetical protein
MFRWLLSVLVGPLPFVVLGIYLVASAGLILGLALSGRQGGGKKELGRRTRREYHCMFPELTWRLAQVRFVRLQAVLRHIVEEVCLFKSAFCGNSPWLIGVGLGWFVVRRLAPMYSQSVLGPCGLGRLKDSPRSTQELDSSVTIPS